MKVALVHDWLTGMRGGERCLLAFLELYPQADIFTMVHIPGSTDTRIDQRVKQVSFLNKIPKIQKLYRALLPLYPWAISSLDLRGYDLIISLSHAAAKNVRVPPTAKHVCYCFTPMRYIWDQARSYLGQLTPLVWPLIKQLRKWDSNTRRDSRRRVDSYVAISRFVAARIRCFYHAPAKVIFPSVDTSWIKPLKQFQPGVAFLMAGALVPYKQPEVVIKAFNQLGLPLWVVGSGPEETRLKQIAKSNISFFGHVSDSELADFYARCRGLVFPGIEDFGMIPVECMAAGRPVIALYAGGLRESVSGYKPWKSPASNKSLINSDPYTYLDHYGHSGVFIKSRNVDPVQALVASLKLFVEQEMSFTREACVRRAALFGPEQFRLRWKELAAEIGIPASSNLQEANSMADHAHVG